MTVSTALAGLACGVILMAVVFGPAMPSWVTPPRHVEQQAVVQRAYPLLPLQLTPQEREQRVENDYQRLSDEVQRLHSYRDRLETYLTQKRGPAGIGDVSKDEHKTLQEVLDRVRDHIHELEAQRDGAYQAWVESKKR